MQSRFRENVEIKPGSTGQFDVIVDGTTVFSKSKVHRFPNDGEVENLFDALRSGKELPPIEQSRGGFVNRILSKLRN